MARRNNGGHAVTPRTHGVTTAHAVYPRKPAQLIHITNGATTAQHHNLSHTPVTAMYNMA